MLAVVDAPVVMSTVYDGRLCTAADDVVQPDLTATWTVSVVQRATVPSATHLSVFNKCTHVRFCDYYHHLHQHFVHSSEVVARSLHMRSYGHYLRELTKKRKQVVKEF